MFRGYIEAIRKIEKQLQQSASNLEFDDIVVACGWPDFHVSSYDIYANVLDRCLLYGAIESHQ